MKYFMLLALLSLFQTSFQYELPPKENLRIHLDFDSSLMDKSGNGNDGTLMGQGSINYVDGAVGISAEMNIGFPYGILNANYIKIRNSKDTQLGEDYTISFWARKASNARMLDCQGNLDYQEPWAAMFSLGGLWEEGFTFYLYSIYYGFWYPSGSYYGNSYFNQGYDFRISDPNDWVNFIFSKKGDQSKIYLNGTLVSSIYLVPNVDFANQRDLFLGAMSGNGFCSNIMYPLDGALDDVRIYDISISDEQALAIFYQNNDIKNCITSIKNSKIEISGSINNGNNIGVTFKFLKVCPGDFKYKAYIGSKNKSSLSQLELKSSIETNSSILTFKDSEVSKYDCSTSLEENFQKTVCTIYLRAFAEQELVFEHVVNLHINRDLKFNVTKLWNSVGGSSDVGILGHI